MADIRKRASGLIQSSISVNTKLAYQTALRNFNSFRQTYAMPTYWPVPTKQVILYIAYCFEKDYAPSTIMLYTAGISFIHKVNGYPDPSVHFVINKMLEGCRRLRKRQDFRAPISRKMLSTILKILKNVCNSSHEILLFKSVFSLAYFGPFSSKRAYRLFELGIKQSISKERRNI